jgi:hypothetical protein
MIQGFKLFPGEYVCEFLPANGEDMLTEQEMFGDNAPDGMQLGGILGLPDEPELYVLSEAFRDACTECLDEHEQCHSDPAESSDEEDEEILLEHIPGYMPMAEAEIDKGFDRLGE